MARGFDATDGVGSTDAIATTYTANATTQSWSIWVYRTGDSVSGNGRLWQKVSTGYRAFYEDVGTNKYTLEISWTTAGLWTIARPSASAWHHILITYDGSSTANDPIIYVDGSSVTVTRSVAPTGSLITGSGAYYIGNENAGIRVWNGRLAEFGVWSRILSSGEATTLNGGFTPSCLPSGLVAYWPIQGTASPEPELIAAANGTLTGTAAQTHPTVKQPEQHLFGHLGRLIQGRIAA